MLRGFTSVRPWLGLATVTLASLGNASSEIEIQAAGQTAAPACLEPLVLDGLPPDEVLGVPTDADHFLMDVTEPTSLAIHTSAGVDPGALLCDSDGGLIAYDDGGRGPISALTRTSYAAARTCSGLFLLTRDSLAVTRSTRLRSPSDQPTLQEASWRTS